jgi:hypothetical protein
MHRGYTFLWRKTWANPILQMIAARIQSKSTVSAAASGAPSKALQAAIEELPPFGLSSLESGDTLILSCTSGEDVSKAMPITVLAGVEPLYKTSKGVLWIWVREIWN